MRGGQNSLKKNYIYNVLMAGTAIMLLVQPIDARSEQTTPAIATTSGTQINIPSQSLPAALVAFSRQTKIETFVQSALVKQKTSKAVRGNFAPEVALQQLLSGTGLAYTFTNPTTVRIFSNDTASATNNIAADGSLQLDTITVSGGPAMASVNSPFETPAAVSYISGETIERFSGSAPADIFRGTPGVLSGEARNGSSIDVNIRGLQGMGRVPVTVDGTISSATVYQGYQGVSNRTYIDPDLIGGVNIEKGPSTGAYGGIGGAVSMDTINASNILRDGKNFGVRLKGEIGTNTSSVPALNTVGGMFFNGSRPGTVVGPADFDRPGSLKPTRESGSIAAAARGDFFEIVGAYATRNNGNYHAGKNGPTAESSENLGPRTICRNFGVGQPICTYYPAYYENTGVSTYRGGEEVLNTSSDTDSWLVKGKFEFLNDQTIELSHIGYRSDYGEIRPSLLSSTMGMQSTQRWPSRSSVDRYSIRHRWNPEENSLIDLKSNLWFTNFRQRSGTTASARDAIRLNLPSPLLERILVGANTSQWGADVTNTSRFDVDFGQDLAINYGVSYTSEDTEPTKLTKLLEGQFLPPNGTRDQWQIFTNGKLNVNDWLAFDASYRFTSFKTEDRSELKEIPSKAIDGQQFSRSGSGFSPSLGIIIYPTDGVQLYTRYSEGLRMPSLAESASIATTLVTSDIEPERSKNWDIGINSIHKGLLSGNDELALKASWFNNTVDDYISRQTVPVTIMPNYTIDFLSVRNIARAKFQGFELSGRYNIDKLSVELGGNYYTDMKFCKTVDNCLNNTLYGDYATNQVPPKYMTSLTVEHKFFEDALTLGIRATHMGPRAIKAGQPTIQGASPFIAPIKWRPYTLVDVFASYEFSEQVKADFRIDNIGDIHYVDPLGLANIPGPGRTAWASLTTKF